MNTSKKPQDQSKLSQDKVSASNIWMTEEYIRDLPLGPEKRKADLERIRNMPPDYWAKLALKRVTPPSYQRRGC